MLLLWAVASPLGLSAQQNAIPAIDQPLVPTSVAPGAPGFTMTVNGADFVAGAVVKWNGSPRATQFVSAGQLTASILASDVANVGSASISVTNPPPGGGTSDAVQFPVAAPRGTVTLTRSDFPGGRISSGLASADLNGDGVIDLIVPNVADDTVSVFLGDGHGSFGTRHDYATGVSPGTAAVGDFNGDGILDFAVSNSNCSVTASSCANSPAADGSISVFLGNGDGTFRPRVDYDAGPWTTAVMVGDVNGDGKLDLIAVNGTCPGAPCYTPSSSVSVLLGNGDGTFQARANYAVGLRPLTGSGVVGDFNGDGRLDIAVSNDFDSTVSVLLGNGDGTFQSQKVFPIGPTPTYLGGGERPVGIVAADFNNDGKLDLAVANENANTLSILLGNGDGTFRPEVEYATDQEPQEIAVGDFNGDGVLDIVLTNSNSNTISLYIGNGDGTFQPQIEFGTPASPAGIVSGDFDGDGRLDVAIASQGISGAATGTISVFLATGSGPTVSVTPSASSITTAQPLIVAIAVSGGTGNPTPTGSVTVNSGSYTSPSATLSSGTATITIPAGSLAMGTDTLTGSYSGDSNYGAATGTASVVVNTSTGPSCIPTFSPSGAGFSAQGGLDFFSITVPPTCPLNPTSSADWIRLLNETYYIPAGTQSAETFTISFAVAADTGGPRTGAISVNGSNFNIDEAGFSCTYSVVPGDAVFSSSGGVASITVEAPTGCKWTATSNTSWLRVTTGATGAGTGRVQISASANLGPARNGTLIIAGQAFQVTQNPVSSGGSGPNACGAVDVTSKLRIYSDYAAPSLPDWTYYYQHISITNTSSSAVNGPLYLVFVGLPGLSGISPSPGTPLTHCFSSGGDYILYLGSSGLGPRANLNPFPFVQYFVDGRQLPINYVPKVLSGFPSK